MKIENDMTNFARTFINEVQELIERISVFDPDIRGLDARKCLFRINRDIRFSLDKSPYKTYMSACIAQGGRHSIRGAYYFHLEPEYCVLSVVFGIPNRKY